MSIEHSHWCRGCDQEIACLGDTGPHDTLQCDAFDGYCDDCDSNHDIDIRIGA